MERIYPLTFWEIEEIFLEKPWGGDMLGRKFGKSIPDGVKIGESWEVSDYWHVSDEGEAVPAVVSVVGNGPLAGQTLHEVMEQWGEALLGRRARKTPGGLFPLLFKLLDAHDWLSIQTHPDDETALRFNEPDVGKAEMWYVLHSECNPQMVFGLKEGVTEKQLRDGVETETLEPLLNMVEVNAGDAFAIMPGTVHTIGDGIVVAEIQQNSDLTYRVYDYGRVMPDGTKRELHIDKAVATIDFGAPPPGKVVPEVTTRDGNAHKLLCSCKYFEAELVEVDSGKLEQTLDGGSFHIVFVVEGEPVLESSSAVPSQPLDRAQTALVPAGLEGYTIEGGCRLLRYWVP